MFTLTTGDGDPLTERWVTGDLVGLPIPADAEALLAGGAEFLTTAFRAAGSLDGDNSVEAIVGWKEFVGGGSGKKLLLTVAYERPDAALPERLFVKFSRNFDDELWDRARHMMISEVQFALLSRRPDFPVKVPRCLFADVEAASATGLLVTECIPYGEGDVEPLYEKCMDYVVEDPLGHYRVILRNLARLSGAHRAGRLGAELDRAFPYDHDRATGAFGVHATHEKLVHWANRMFDFCERYPQLFPEAVRTPGLRRRFITDLDDVVAASDRIRQILAGNREFVAFAHWNANIDNCWFERDAQGALDCGFIDWANAGPLSVAQSITGVLSAAGPGIWRDHLDELLEVFVDEFAAQGGPRLALDQLRLHILLMTVSAAAFSMGAPVAVPREIADIGALSGPQDPLLRQHLNARVQLHMMTNLLENWQTFGLGDLVRRL